jgi:hypothetical protein
MGTDALHRSARNTLGRLARARMDNDAFWWEAAEVLRRAIGFDTWCWGLLDPATGLPTRYTLTNPVLDQDLRRFFQLDLQSRRPAWPLPGRIRPAGGERAQRGHRRRFGPRPAVAGDPRPRRAWATSSAPPSPPMVCTGPT